MFRYDTYMGSVALVLLLGSGGCQRKQERDLAALFPDAAHALGAFSMQMETSRPARILSEAKIAVQQERDKKQITLLMKMNLIQEQVTLNFLRQSQPSKGQARGDRGFSQGNRIREEIASRQARSSVQDDSRCAAPSAYESELPTWSEGNRTTTLPHAAALLSQYQLAQLILPSSIQEAADFNVEVDTGSAIRLQWTREAVREMRYPLAGLGQPQNLRARRITGDIEEDIPVTWDHGFALIHEADVRAGSWLQLRYEIPGREDDLELPHEPLPDGLKTLALIPGCLRSDFILEKNHLTWTCPQQEGPVWAAAYHFYQPTQDTDVSDWPEIADIPPDKQEKLTNDDGQMICQRTSWSSLLTR